MTVTGARESGGLQRAPWRRNSDILGTALVATTKGEVEKLMKGGQRRRCSASRSSAIRLRWKVSVSVTPRRLMPEMWRNGRHRTNLG